MRRDAQAATLLLVSAAMLRLSLSGAYQAYIKSSMGQWVTAAGTALLVLAGWSLRREVSTAPEGPDNVGHGHGTGRIAWLVLAPVLTIFLVAPPPLGAYAAERAPSSIPRPTALPGLVGNPVRLDVVDYSMRAVWTDGRTLAGRTVELVGFVTTLSGTAEDAWYLTKLQISCCAADARAYRVKVLGAPLFPVDTWVRVTGRWVPGGGTQRSDAIPWIQASSVVPTERPANPYE